MRLFGTSPTLLLVFSLRLVLAKDSANGLTEVDRVTLDNVTYINKGLVAFGLIPSDFRESTGDTLGGIGSAIALKPNSWVARANGTFSGTFIVHPDRGYNVKGPIDYQSRHHEIDFTLSPYYGSKKLTFSSAQQTLVLEYKKTVLEYDVNNKTTSGLDPQGIRMPSQATMASFPAPLPIVSDVDNRLVLDIEGIVANADGSFWISDEYAPGIYRISPSGVVVQALSIPDAIVPRDEDGNLFFTSEDDPKTGRAANHGFEGFTIDPTTGWLYAMLQAATIQDGGHHKDTSRYTRLLAFDVQSNHSTVVGEWVVPLPLKPNGNTAACSEIAFVGNGVFLALSRDGDGRGGDDDKSKYKNADLFSIRHATDIHGMKFDSRLHPLAPKGKLDSSIKPATYVSFVSYIDADQLARFGLHNGSPNDETLLDAKWESLALVPVGDPDFPDDYFLFTASDNDYQTIHGISLGKPFDAGIDVDNQFLVFRVTLPGAVLKH